MSSDPGKIDRNFDYSKIGKEGFEFTEVPSSEIAARERQQSSLSSVQEREEELLQHFMEGVVPIEKPDEELLSKAESSLAPLSQKELTSQKVEQQLTEIPQFNQLLEAAGIDKNDAVESVRQYLLEHNPTAENIAQLTGQALIERMELASALKPDNLEIRASLNSLKVDQLIQQFPQTEVLRNILIKEQMAEGKSLEEATAYANQKIASDVAGVKKNGEIHETLTSALALKVGSTPEEGAATVSKMENVINTHQSMMDLINNTQQVKGPDINQDEAVNIQSKKIEKMVDSELEKIEELTAVIRNLPIPGEQKVALLQYLSVVLNALQEIKRMQSELSTMEGKKTMSEAQSKIQQADIKYANIMKEIDKALKLLSELRSADSGFLSTFSGVFGIVMMAVIIAVILLVAVVVIAINPANALWVIPLALALMAPIITFFVINQTGDMEKLTTSLMLMTNQVIEMIVGEEPADWIGATVMGVIMGVLAFILIIAMILLFVLMFVVAGPLALIAIAIALTMMTVILQVLLQMVFSMMMEAGVSERSASAIAEWQGMDKGEEAETQEGLKATMVAGTAATGGTTSDHTLEYDYGWHDEEMSEAERKGEDQMEIERRGAEDKRQRLNPYLHIQETVNLVSLGMNAKTEKTAGEEMDEYQQMLPLFNQLIKMIEQFIQALLTGTDPKTVVSDENMEAMVKNTLDDLQDFIKNNLTEYMANPEMIDQLDFEGIMPTIMEQIASFRNDLTPEKAQLFKQFSERVSTGEMDLEGFRKG